MGHTIEEIAKALDCEAVGDLNIRVTGLSEPGDATPDHLAMATTEAYAAKLSSGKARAALLGAGADWQALGLEAAIFAPRPRYTMSALSAMMDPGPRYGAGIHDTAIVDPSAEIGADVSIGPFTIIGPGARIGDRSVIGPQCYIGADVELGPDARLREQVVLCHGVTIGARFITQAGVRIGGDGFSFVTPEESGVERVRSSLGDQGETREQSWLRIHSLGGVTIGDDVEVGANATIDRGTIRDTRIGKGTKVDNLVMVGHNVVIGDDCLLCGLVGVAGSTTIGNNCVFAGQVGINDNIFIGDNVIAGGGSKIMSNVPTGRVLLGYPATKMDSQMETYKALRRLPRLSRDVAALKNSVFKSDKSD